MPYIHRRACIDVNDKACVAACPVDRIDEGPAHLFIHPAGDPPSRSVPGAAKGALKRVFERRRRDTSSRYHREEFVLDALVDYQIEVDDPTREVPNPARLPDYRVAGTGMMAKPIAIPRARITAAIITATEMFPFRISSHSSMGVSQSNTRNKIPRPKASDTAPTTPHPTAIK